MSGKLLSILKNHGILSIVIVFILIIKIPHLFMPYSFDEAWSYIPAIFKMAQNGPNLLPGSIELESSKGHPLLFYFIVSLWINIFSDKIFIVRLVPLIISIFTIIILYFLAKRHISLPVANCSILLLSVQSLFLAQSTLILPEMLLTLFLLLSFHFYLMSWWWLYALFASLMTLTKETGLVFGFGFGLFYLIENIKLINRKKFWFNLFLISVPIFIFCLHVILNYIAYKSFFFQEHLNYISIDFTRIIRVLKSATGILFTMYGRNVITGVALISFVILLVRKKRIENVRLLLLILIQIILLLIFTSINFYTYRYTLPAFPVFIVLSMVLFNQALEKKKLIFYPILIVMVGHSLFYTLTKKGNADIDFGYTTFLPVHERIVEYCEKQNWYDKTLAANFNMGLALRDPITGYLKSGNGFKVQHFSKIDDAEVVIIDSAGEWKKLPENVSKQFNLVKKFNYKNSWGEIYVRKK